MIKRGYEIGRCRLRILTGSAVAGFAVVGLLALTAYLSSPTRPVSWVPTPVSSLWASRFRPNNALSRPSRFECGGSGPESIAVNPVNGDLATGFNDGEIRLIPARKVRSEAIANTRGLPLGLGFLPDSSLVVADALRGLVHVDRTGQVWVLSTKSEGMSFVYPDGLIVDATGHNVYFTDLATTHRPGPDLLEVIEHSGTGRLLRYDTLSRRTTTLLNNLQGANGVALGPEGAYILINETEAYRIRRYWLTGPLAGRSEIFSDGLPGFPDNITFNGRDRFWIAIAAPRSRLLDALAGFPAARRLFTPYLLTHIIAPRPASSVIAIDPSGKPVESLQGQGPHAYLPITEAHEVGPRLILGSDDARCLAFVTLSMRGRGSRQADR